jgi:hypothetical protein
MLRSVYFRMCVGKLGIKQKHIMMNQMTKKKEYGQEYNHIHITYYYS